MSDASENPAPGAVEPTRSRRPWLIGLAVVLLSAAAIAGVATWRWFHALDRFDPGGNKMGGPIAVGRTEYANTFPSLNAAQPATLDVHAIHPVVEENTADAVIRVMVCRRLDALPTLIGFGAANAFCAAPRPFRAGRLRFADDDSHVAVLVAVTARRPGRVVLHGIRISYGSGVRDATETTGIWIDATAR